MLPLLPTYFPYDPDEARDQLEFFSGIAQLEKFVSSTYN
jgi:hypothetical protein